VSGERHDANVRQRALRLLELGRSSSEVAEEIHVPAGTVRYWAQGRPRAARPPGEDPISWAESERRIAESSQAAAIQALIEVRKLLDRGRYADAKQVGGRIRHRA
jgi:hypothetical protein